MKNLAQKKIQRIGLYAPPIDGRRSFPGALLDFNERTVPPSRAVRAALRRLAASLELQIYPEYFDLEKKIARYAGVAANQILITNGSDQGIELIFRAFTNEKDTVIIPTPSFAMFYQCAGAVGNKLVTPYYRADLSFPIDEVLAAITPKIKLVVICNPNNPTGTLVPLRDIKRIAKKAAGAIVYVDEAYFEFSGVTAVPLIKKYPNIIVTRTFSKAFGLGSLRVGYVIATPQYIEEFRKVRGPYDVNMAGYYAAEAALSDKTSMQKYAREVMNRAKPIVEKFFRAQDVPYFPS